MGHSRSSCKSKVYGNKPVHLKEQRSQINTSTLHQKELEKEEQTKPKRGRRKETIRIRAEIYQMRIEKV